MHEEILSSDSSLVICQNGEAITAASTAPCAISMPERAFDTVSAVLVLPRKASRPLHGIPGYQRSQYSVSQSKLSNVTLEHQITLYM